jgi:hypothetical protein
MTLLGTKQVNAEAYRTECNHHSQVELDVALHVSSEDRVKEELLSEFLQKVLHTIEVLWKETLQLKPTEEPFAQEHETDYR